MSRGATDAPSGSTKHRDPEDTGAGKPLLNQRDRAKDRTNVPCSEQPPSKKLRLTDDIPFDIYDNGPTTIPRTSCRDRANALHRRRHHAPKDVYLDDAVFNSPNGHCHNWDAPLPSGETSSVLSRDEDHGFAPNGVDDSYGKSVTRRDHELLSSKSDSFARYTNNYDSKGVVTNDPVGEGHCDGNSRSYQTSIVQGSDGRNNINDAICLDSYNAIRKEPRRLMDRSFANDRDKNGYATQACLEAANQNGAGGESIVSGHSQYPRSFEGNDTFQVEDLGNTSGTRNLEIPCSSKGNTRAKAEGHREQVDVPANPTVNVGSAAAVESTTSSSNSTSSTTVCPPFAQYRKDALDSSARSGAFDPHGHHFRPFASCDVSRFGGNVHCNNGAFYSQLFASCYPNHYGAANNISLGMPVSYVSCANDANSQAVNQVTCGAFYNAQTYGTNLSKEQNVNSAVETGQRNKFTASHGSSCVIAKETSASVLSTDTFGGDTFDPGLNGLNATYCIEPIRGPVNEQVPSYRMLQYPGQVIGYGTNDFREAVGQSSFDSTVGYREPKRRYMNEKMGNCGVVEDPENNLAYSTPSDTFHEAIDQNTYVVHVTAGYNGHTQLSDDRSDNSNVFTGSNTNAHNTNIFPGSVGQDANLEYGADYYDQVQGSIINRSYNMVDFNSSSNEAFASVPEFFPRKVQEALSSTQTPIVAMGYEPAIVNGSGERSDLQKQVLPGTVGQCVRDDSSGSATTAEDSLTAPSVKVVTPGVSSAEEIAVPWEIGPQACPGGCAEEMRSLDLHAALESLKPSERKLKWPLPIPLFVKPRDKSLSFRFVDYGWLSQCVYLAAQEEVFAQTLDHRGWLKIFVKSTRAAHNLVQVQSVYNSSQHQKKKERKA